MPEIQEATDGYNGEMWLFNGTELYELAEVTAFDIPDEGEREQMDKTHLKSPGRRRQYFSTWFADSDFEIVLNSRPRSDTDLLLSAARRAGDVRAFKAVIPEEGEPVSQITGTCRVINYNRGRAEDGKMEATATCRVVTIDEVEEYEAPAP